jgi:hypothetical protein
MLCIFSPERRRRSLRHRQPAAKMRRLRYQHSTMEERTTSSLRQHRLRFELIFASVWLGFGLFLLPALIFWVGITMLGPYGEGQGAGMGTFYGDFFGDLAEGEGRAWSLALGPLVLIYALRAIFIGTRPRTEPQAASEPELPPAHKAADARRVEPRISAD